MFLTLLSILSPLYPLIAGHKRRSSPLWYAMLASLCAGLGIAFLRLVLHINYYWPVNIYLLIEFILLSLYYKKEAFPMKTSFNFFFVLFPAAFLMHTICIARGGNGFNIAGANLFHLAYVLFSLLGFYRLLREQKISLLEKSSFFWANTALLMYASGNLIIALLRHNVAEAGTEAMMIAWQYIFLSLYMLKNILIGIALSRKQSS